MSSLTSEWQLKRENGIKYWIDIRNFNKKMNWPWGKQIYSRKFKISESVFSIFINPSGNSSSEKDHVSIYLRNESNWNVRLSDVSFKVGHHVRTSSCCYYEAGESCGVPLFVSQDEIEAESLLDKYGTFCLEVDVQLLEEEVVASRPTDNGGDDLLALKTEVSMIKKELEGQR